MKVKTNRKTNITTTYPKLKDTVEHRIIKYRMVLSYEQHDLDIVKSLGGIAANESMRKRLWLSDESTESTSPGSQ